MENVLDVYSGAGGLSLGLEKAGFAVAGGVDFDRDSCDTFAKLHPAANVICGDVRLQDFTAWRSRVSVVAGGVPCQPWSTGGKMLGPLDERNGWPAFLRVLAEVRPDAFIAENVAGLGSRAWSLYLAELVARLESLGFAVASQVLDAAGYGVPQRRRRLLLVGMRGTPFRFPAPQPDSPRPAGVVVASCPAGEPNPSPVTYARNPDLRPDPYAGHVYNGGGRPIDLARPAPTLLASMGGNKTPWVDTADVVPGYHAELLAGVPPRSGQVPGARRITVQEAALLQSFPGGVSFVGSRSSQYRQVGNAVPPLLACAVGVALREQLSAV